MLLSAIWSVFANFLAFLSIFLRKRAQTGTR